MANQLSLFAEEKVQKQIYEFLIVINLPDGINEYVEGLKDEFNEKFGFFPSRGSQPHITISKFPLLDKQPDAIISFLKRSFQGVSPFKIDLNGFDSFPSSKVIYLNVEDSPELDKLKAPFNYIREDFKPKKYFHVLKNKPHITIARGLQPDIFDEAIGGYTSRQYENSFIVDKLKMLRRENYGGGKYSKYEQVTDLVLGGV
jgi:2'-5' RNA ligase